ncbi:MAG TPA: hypothetical protein VIP54_07590, partial [Microterricola sp.]
MSSTTRPSASGSAAPKQSEPKQAAPEQTTPEQKAKPAASGRRGFGRRGAAVETGPRAKFSQLMPYLLEHKVVLSVVVVLSILGAAASLAQPLLVGKLIEVVQAGQPLGMLVWALVALVVIAALISGYQHYLLQRTGEGVVLSS